MSIPRASGGASAQQCAIEFAEIARQRVPQRLLEDDEPAADLVERRRPVAPHFVGFPAGDGLAPQRLHRHLAFEHGEIGAILQRQCLSDAIVLLQERATDVFGAAGMPSSEPPVDLKVLHAKIGQLTQENDFLEGALTKAGLLSAKR